MIIVLVLEIMFEYCQIAPITLICLYDQDHAWKL